jgi:hypothetical protein
MNPTSQWTLLRPRTKKEDSRKCTIRSATLLLLLLLLHETERISQARAWQPVSVSPSRPRRHAVSCSAQLGRLSSTIGQSRVQLHMLALPEGAASSSSSQYNPSPPRTWSQRPGWPPKPTTAKQSPNVSGVDTRGAALSLPLNWFSPVARTNNATSLRSLSLSFPAPLRASSPLSDSSRAPYHVQQRRSLSSPPLRRRQKMKPMPILGYDALAIEEYYDVRPLEVGWRLNSLGFPLLGKLLLLLVVVRRWCLVPSVYICMDELKLSRPTFTATTTLSRVASINVTSASSSCDCACDQLFA